MINLIYFVGIVTGVALLLLWAFVHFNFLWLFIPPPDRWFD